MAATSFRDFKKATLIACYDLHEAISEEFFRISTLEKFETIKTKPTWLITAVKGLIEDKFVETVNAFHNDPPSENTFIRLTAKGFEYAEDLKNPIPEPVYEQRAKSSKFSDFKNALLVSLARADAKNPSAYFDLKSVADDDGLKYNPGWIGKAGEDLNQYGYLKEAFGSGGLDEGYEAALTAKGLERAEELDQNLIEQIGITSRVITPASDRYVSKKDNQKAWQDIADALEEVAADIKADTNLDNQLGPTKNAFVKTIEAVRELFEDTRIKIRVGIVLTIEPLQEIATQYKQAIASSLISSNSNKVVGLIENLLHQLKDLFLGSL